MWLFGPYCLRTILLCGYFKKLVSENAALAACITEKNREMSILPACL